MSESTSNQDLQTRLFAADEAFASYDFGPDIEIVEQGNWDSSDVRDLTKVAYAKYSDDPADANSHKISFHVRFTDDGDIEEAYALEMEHGSEIGVPRSYVAPLPNIEFSYLYRDGSNCKRYGSVIFANPERLDCEEFAEQLAETMDENTYFIAGQVGIPEVFHWLTDYPVTELDHCWHESDSVVATERDATTNETAAQLLQRFQGAAAQGWQEFGPASRPDARTTEAI